MSVEKSDVRASRILQIGAGLCAMVAVSFAAIYFWIRSPEPVDRKVARTWQVELPQPRLQTSQTADLQAMQAADARTLQTYGWVEQPAGIARVPIQRAMEMTLQQGLPARAADSP